MQQRGLLSQSNVWITVVFLMLALFPFMTNSNSTLIIFTHVFVIAIFAMSYDLLLGYSGIVSFGHVIFFGIGAYSVGIFMSKFQHTYWALGAAVVVSVILSAIISFIVGILTLRLKSHFYAMLTLALSGLFVVGAEKWRSMTKGKDGLSFIIPSALKDRMLIYFIALLLLLFTLLLLRRITRSPFGKVLVAIRENDTRAEAIGYQVVHFKIVASVISGMVASLSGCIHALSLRFVDTTVFGANITLDALLMTIIGGIGTLYGAIIGAGLIELAHSGLANLSKVHWIFERWMILFGLVYILCVMLFPYGIIGTIRLWWFKRKDRKTRDTHSTHMNREM
jgi:branched-chain amino acid transport system permease protein